MLTTLVFLDSKEQSKEGTLRGLFALAIVITVSFIWYGLIGRIFHKYLQMSNYISWIALLIFAVLLSSALVVAQPGSGGTAAVYGALVGLVIFGCYNSMLIVAVKFPVSLALLDTMYGIGLCTFVSYITYVVFKERYI